MSILEKGKEKQNLAHQSSSINQLLVFKNGTDYETIKIATTN